MRKPRDFDAELKALSDKARLLKEHRLRQLGELVIATGADALPLEQLAGALLGAAEDKEQSTTEGWRRRGAAFFQVTRKAGGGARDDARRASTDNGGASSASGNDRAQ
jgi:DNA-binding transcriptional ArsR family regulator